MCKSQSQWLSGFFKSELLSPCFCVDISNRNDSLASGPPATQQVRTNLSVRLLMRTKTPGDAQCECSEKDTFHSSWTFKRPIRLALQPLFDDKHSAWIVDTLTCSCFRVYQFDRPSTKSGDAMFLQYPICFQKACDNVVVVSAPFLRPSICKTFLNNS